MVKIESHFLNKEVVVGLLASVAFVGLYFRDINLEKAGLNSGEPIGTIIESDPEVSRRPHNRTVWIPVSKNLMVFEKDTIRTGPGSETTIDLKSQGTITLRPDSLAIIETENREFKVHLADGDLFLSGNITAQVGDTKVQGTKGSKFSIKRDHFEGNINVASREGSVVVSSKAGKKETIEKGQTLDTQETSQKVEIQTFTYVTVRPDPTLPIVSEEIQNITVEFEVQPVSENVVEAEKWVQVFSDKKQKKLLKQLKLESGQNKISFSVPKEGQYYWILKNQSLSQAMTPMASFDVKSIPKPKPIESAQLMSPLKPEIEINKQDPRQSVFTVAGASGLAGPALDLEVQMGDAEVVSTIEKKADGSFRATFGSDKFYRADAKLALRYIYKDSLKSEWARFSFDPELFAFEKLSATPASLVYPPNDRSYIGAKVLSQGISFEWESSENKYYKPKEYVLELKSLSGDIVQNKTNQNQLRVKEKLKPGKYTWNVKTIWSIKGVESISESKSFEIKQPKVGAESQVLRAPAFVGED